MLEQNIGNSYEYEAQSTEMYLYFILIIEIKTIPEKAQKYQLYFFRLFVPIANHKSIRIKYINICQCISFISEYCSQKSIIDQKSLSKFSKYDDPAISGDFQTSAVLDSHCIGIGIGRAIDEWIDSTSTQMSLNSYANVDIYSCCHSSASHLPIPLFNHLLIPRCKKRCRNGS